VVGRPDPDGFGRYFFGEGKGGFCRGFLKKRGAERGFLMVRMWFFCGETWWVDGHYFGVKNLPLSKIFFRILASANEVQAV
jgi:hypothetical protein